MELIFQGHNSMQCLKAFTGREHYTRFGTFAHDDIIGKAFGSKVCLHLSIVHALRSLNIACVVQCFHFSIAVNICYAVLLRICGNFSCRSWETQKYFCSSSEILGF